MEPKGVEVRLNQLFGKYLMILENNSSTWEDINEARAILYLTGQVYCEQIAVEAIERRLHLLKEKLSLIEFFNFIDRESEKLFELRKDDLFKKLEEFYRIVKKFKNKYLDGKFYLAEEHFIKRYSEKNPDKDLRIGYKGGFNDKDFNFLN